MPVEQPAEETPADAVVPGPSGVEMEEGEILATIGAVMVVLDPEEEAVAAVVGEAGQAEVAGGPPAATESEVEKAPSFAGEGEAVIKRTSDGVEKARWQRAKPRSSSWWSSHHSSRQLEDETPERQRRLAPRLPSMEDAREGAILLSRA